MNPYIIKVENMNAKDEDICSSTIEEEKIMHRDRVLCVYVYKGIHITKVYMQI